MRHRWILLVAAAVVILYSFPGLMGADSADQLDGARRGAFGDWHPPAMSVLWWLVELLVAGPFGMLVLQTTAFVVGCYLILRSELAPRHAAIATMCIAWFPPILIVIGVVWKDAQMAGYLLLGIALLLQQSRLRWVGIAILVVATAMRHNAPAATLVPLLLLFPPVEATWLRRAAIGFAAWLCITIAAFGTNYLLAQRSENPWVISVATTDIAGIVRWSPPYTDAELQALFAGAPLRVERDIQQHIVTHYETRGWFAYHRKEPVIGFPETAAQSEAIARIWRELVLAQPGAYLRHRWEVFARVLDMGGGRNVPPVVTEFSYKGDASLFQRLSHDASPSGFQRLMFWFVRSFGGLFYVGFIYAAVSLVLLRLARRAPVALSLLLSGLLYEASLFIVAPSPDYRYSHWLTTTTLIAGVLLAARRIRAR